MEGFTQFQRRVAFLRRVEGGRFSLLRLYLRLLFNGDIMVEAQKVRNGTLKLLSESQTQSLLDRMGDKPSMRRAYLKLACLAVLKYDADGRYLNADQIATLAEKYLPKTVGMSPQQVGTILGALHRFKVVNRSYNRPHTYWWREEGEH